MAKIRNDRCRYTRRSDLVAGSSVIATDRNRTADSERARKIAARLQQLKREFVNF